MNETMRPIFDTTPCLTRRRFILNGTGLAGALTLGIAPSVFARKTKNTRKTYWVSAQGANNENYSLSWLQQSLNSTSITSSSTAHTASAALSSFRGHGSTQHPLRSSSVVMFARRPGLQGIEVNLDTGKIDAHFKCAKDRHLFGHGCFSHDGNYLFTSEANYQNGLGKIGIRDASNYQLLGEYESYGIGPHELKILPDNKTLVVANSGILTHPKTGRKKLNLATMNSMLTYIDITNGQQLDSFKVSEPKASIRHIDIATDGSVVFALQVQRSAMNNSKTVALAGIHAPGKKINLFEQPSKIIEKMNDYMGSVAVNSRSRIAGFTTPRGNFAAFWHIDSHEFIGYHRLRDVCGIAVSHDQKHFIISNSQGQLRQLDAENLQETTSARIQLPNTRWDNHLLVVTT